MSAFSFSLAHLFSEPLEGKLSCRHGHFQSLCTSCVSLNRDIAFSTTIPGVAPQNQEIHSDRCHQSTDLTCITLTMLRMSFNTKEKSQTTHCVPLSHLFSLLLPGTFLSLSGDNHWVECPSNYVCLEFGHDQSQGVLSEQGAQKVMLCPSQGTISGSPRILFVH